MRDLFNDTLQILSANLPDGIVRANRPNSTPLILFEAVAVGVADILSVGESVDPDKLVDILDDQELKRLTTGATNSLPKLRGRIQYVAEHVLA